MSNRAPRLIVLTGFMGAGKTTVAASLARQLNCDVIDLDELIEQREKRSVASIIREDGEAQFRQTETAVLSQVLTEKTTGVVALGGGTWAIERNRELIKEHGALSIWLDASFTLCWQRITRVKHDRPLARTREQTRRLYDQRRPLYELAALRIDVSVERSAAKVAAEIIQSLQ